MHKKILGIIIVVVLIVIVALMISSRNDDLAQQPEANQVAQLEAEKQAEYLQQKAQLEAALQVAYQGIVGTWQSDADSKAEVVFKVDGGTMDIYDGEQVSSGTWSLYADTSVEYNPTGVFLKVEIDGTVYEYAVITIDKDTLEINYLERGNTLSYSRVSQ